MLLDFRRLFESDDILLLQCQNQCFVSVTGAYTNVKSLEASVKNYHKGNKTFYSYILSSISSEYLYTVLLLVAIFGIYIPGNDGPLGSLVNKGTVSLKYHGRRTNSSEFAPHLQILLSLWPQSNLANVNLGWVEAAPI